MIKSVRPLNHSALNHTAYSIFHPKLESFYMIEACLIAIGSWYSNLSTLTNGVALTAQQYVQMINPFVNIKIMTIQLSSF